jgi:hypothetical protein
MRSLHLHDVPDDVYEQLARRAAFDGTSVEIVAVRDLADASCRAHNRSLLVQLPDHAMSVGSIVSDLDDVRDER